MKKEQSKICISCGVKYNKGAHVAQKTWAKSMACSLKCLGDFKNRRITTECDYCHTVIQVKRNMYAKKKNNFCSRGCYSLYREHFLPKEEQHAYGKGHSSEERQKRAKARSILNHYLRDNKIQRPGCEICGDKSEAHHEDYNKPIDVRWLCRKHHRQEHKKQHTTL